MVPNAPCGVESVAMLQSQLFVQIVPNAPCGVERHCPPCKPRALLFVQFLMHRVELKAVFSAMPLKDKVKMFLMHRVELKVAS